MNISKMTEDESMFDPKLIKKKKKKSGFDLDAAIAEGSHTTNETADNDKENIEVDATPADDDEALDLENFGKKKKKKKKFILEELDAVLPDKILEVTESQTEEPQVEDLNLTLDFTMGLKKKKKKKKDLDELMSEERKETEANENEESSQWVGSDRDYTYDELLDRVFNIMKEKNPDMVAGKKTKVCDETSSSRSNRNQKDFFLQLYRDLQNASQTTETFA